MGGNTGFQGFDPSAFFGGPPTTPAPTTTTTTTAAPAVLSFEDMFAQMFGGGGGNPFGNFGAPPAQTQAPAAPAAQPPNNIFGSFGGTQTQVG